MTELQKKSLIEALTLAIHEITLWIKRNKQQPFEPITIDVHPVHKAIVNLEKYAYLQHSYFTARKKPASEQGRKGSLPDPDRLYWRSFVGGSRKNDPRCREFAQWLKRQLNRRLKEQMSGEDLDAKYPDYTNPSVCHYETEERYLRRQEIRKLKGEALRQRLSENP